MNGTPPDEETPQEAASGPETGPDDAAGVEGGARCFGPPETRAVDRRKDLIENLRARPGAKLVAYLLGESTTAALREPGPVDRLADDLDRLGLAREVTDLLAEDAVSGALWTGMNLELGDVSPARLLHDQGGAAREDLLMAARGHHR